MTKRTIKELHIFDTVQKMLEEASNFPVAHIDFSGDGGAFGFHAILVNPRFAILVNQAGMVTSNSYLKKCYDPNAFEITGYDLENLVPVWELQQPVAVDFLTTPPDEPDVSFDKYDPWVEAFYTGDIMTTWPDALTVVENFEQACITVNIICQQHH